MLNSLMHAFPAEERISGKHIEDYYLKNKDNFSGYIKKKLSENISEAFEKVKSQIEN